MDNKKIITLSGFGDFSEDEVGLKELIKTAELYGVECYPTYYDWELKGEADTIEAITKELWGMKRDEWSENALTETEIAPDPNYCPTCGSKKTHWMKKL